MTLLLSSYRVKFPITIHLIDDVATCGFDSLSWRQTNSEFINSDSSHFQVSCDPNMTFFPLHQEKETDSLNHTRCWSGIYYFSQTICKLKKRKSLKRLIPTLKGLILNDGIWALQYIIKSMHWGRNRIYIGGKKASVVSSHLYYIPPILYVSVTPYSRFHTQLLEGKFTQNLKGLCRQIYLRNTDLSNCSIPCLKLKDSGAHYTEWSKPER